MSLASHLVPVLVTCIDKLVESTIVFIACFGSDEEQRVEVFLQGGSALWITSRDGCVRLVWCSIMAASLQSDVQSKG